ncbi:MAG: GNAT family N-acetyltransferase [Alphaproteobacteria bacterium]
MQGLRRARPGDLAAMTDVVRRSKAHWGYDAAFLRHFHRSLAISRSDLAGGRYVVVERAGRLVGLGGRRGRVIDNLFVVPEAIGTGLGRRLLAWLLDDARRAGLAIVLVDSDPFAVGFYRRMGGRPVGWTRSPWPGDPERRLPRLRLVTARRGTAGDRARPRRRRARSDR